ncbi:MAG: hypothetical protein IPL17_20090 [Anaerolineales bacterium]|nr:hypothetical protein [Anaerolineales bacterium]
MLASAILLTPSQSLIEKVQTKLRINFEQRGRADIITASLVIAAAQF